MMPESMSMIRQASDRATQVCLFGVGQLLMECYHRLIMMIGREPDLLCDNARVKWGEHFFGKPCVSPSQLAELPRDTVVIITIRNYEAIFRQLSDMGFTAVFVACYDRCYQTVADIKRIDESSALLASKDISAVPVQGRWTFITGASRGIGRLIAGEMAGRGSNIIAHSREIAHTCEIGRICSAAGVDFIPVAAELGNPDELESMLSQLDRLPHGIDIVFNNAAISPPCPSGFWRSPMKEYIDSYLVNTIAPIRICQCLAPPMIQRGFGRIITITSSIQKRPDEMAYACSKAALNKFVHDLAPSLHGTGVMLTLLDPGWLKTDMGGEGAPHAVESVVPGVLLGALLDDDINGRWFDAQEYAGLTLEEAIRKSKYITAAS